jgi:hypothetical protein
MSRSVITPSTLPSSVIGTKPQSSSFIIPRLSGALIASGPGITRQMSAPVRYAAPTNSDLEVIDELIVRQLV